MTIKLFAAFLLSCALCYGQSVLTTPSEPNQIPAGTSTGAYAPPLQMPRQAADRGVDDASRIPGSETLAPSLTGVKPVTSRIVGPLTAKSEFQQFAEDATGHRLPVYGRQLFDEVPTTFAPLEHVPVPADYVLGPGDELIIRVWGKVELNTRVTLDRNGQVYVPKVGTLNLAGLRYEQVEGYMHSAIANLFKDFELNVALGQLRSIQIFVLGRARQPGAYTVGSLSTLVDAIFASGGPSETGTMRHIKLRRSAHLVADFDIYDLQQNGDKSHDVQLLPGDVIYIPAVGAQVAVSGNVNVPGIYEMKGATTVAAALDGAGGLTSLAGAARISIERIENHSSRRLEEFALDAGGLQRPLQDGDLLRIFPLSPRFENAVTLRGNVAQPGRYVWTEGMRVSDLVPTRDVLITREYWNGQNKTIAPRETHQFGTSHNEQPGNTPAAKPGDSRTDGGSNREVPPDSSSSASPDEKSRSSSDRFDNAPVSMIDTIGQNSAEINWEYAVIERLDDHDLSTRLIPFRLASAIDDHNSSDNQVLKAGDVITVFSRKDIELPMEKHASFVRVSGEVNAPGIYRVSSGDTLRSVVQQAGGLTPHSYLYASLFTRVSTRVVQEEQLRQSADQMQRELISRYANASPASGQTGMDQQAQLSLQQAALARLASVKPTGRIVLEMKPDASGIGDVPDLSLEDGDTFYVPLRLSTVQVAGAVYNANAFRHEPGKQLVSYLNDAGGATREADRRRIFVIRADGTVVSRQSRGTDIHGGFEKLALLPGDAIVVPEKLRVSSRLNDLLQVTQFMSQTALTAAALSVVK